MIHIHLVFHAHLDPVWLWPWQSGLDEAIATCRSACDRLDAHRDLYFSQGEAWVYQQIERIDSALFARIAGHVRSGRWEIVGGWWLQPDCNFPAGFAMQKQIELGRRYFLDRFGVFPKVGFNVDSFGHAAGLPTMMHRAGQNAYVMMRPQEREMQLPARVFRWRGEIDGPQITTFRIASSYVTRTLSLHHIRASLTELPDGLQHTMCFCGLGDHGGGPTEMQIAWLREHAHAIDGAELEFSTTQRFFDAIADQRDRLPLVTGELQHHAIGCYSVQRSTKSALRRAEHRLAQAQVIADRHDAVDEATMQRVADGWEAVCFHHFHDTIGGTCLPSAYQQVNDDLGGAAASADQALHIGLRRMMNALPDDRMQRIVLFNASDTPFDGPVHYEPWLEYGDWQPGWRLIDERGDAVPCQFMGTQGMAEWNRWILFPLYVEAGQMRVLRIDTTADAADGISVGEQAMCHAQASLDLAGSGKMALGTGVDMALPELELIEDATDTWSHGVDRYGQAMAGATWEQAQPLDRGPVMATLHRRGVIGRSELAAEWRTYADQPWVDLLLRVCWMEKHKVLKLTWPMPSAIMHHDDGEMGGPIRRACCGRERPMHDFVRLELADGAAIGVVCPDVYALDVLPQRLRLTLLRSPLMAHHVPNPAIDPRGIVADQGVHEFRFRFTVGLSATTTNLATQATMLHRPLIVGDLTRGMVAH